jgi:hypothetical protein
LRWGRFIKVQIKMKMKMREGSRRKSKIRGEQSDDKGWLHFAQGYPRFRAVGRN